MAYIYKIENDVNGKLYIGKTEFSIEKRFKEHISDAYKESKEKRPLYSAIRKYGESHFHISLVEETENPEEREKYWIEYYGSFKGGYNATLGGDGKRYLDYDLIAKTYQEVKNMAETARLLNISTDSVEKVLKIKKIHILTDKEVKTLNYGKTVLMYDLNDNLLHSFPSVWEAARFMVNNKLTGCKCSTIKQHITEVCTGRRKTAAKFKWRYPAIE